MEMGVRGSAFALGGLGVEVDPRFAIREAPVEVGGAGDFRAHLLAARSAANATTEVTVRRNVEELVARTLVMPVFEMMRRDPLDSGLFERGGAEQSLRPLLEAEVAKEIVARMGPAIVDQVARRLLETSAKPQAGGAKSQAAGVTDHAEH